MHARCLAALAALLPLTSASIDLSRRDLVPSEAPLEDWGYIGCFVDSVAERALGDATHFDTTGLTAESCVAFCADLGYTYAGAEYSVECCKSIIFTSCVTSCACLLKADLNLV